MDKQSLPYSPASQSSFTNTPRHEDISSLAGGGDSGKGYEEAFYLKSDGSPLKYLTPSLNATDLIDQANKDTSSKMPQLLQLDLRFDQLRVSPSPPYFLLPTGISRVNAKSNEPTCLAYKWNVK